MKLRLGDLKRLVHEALHLDEEAWMPGRYFPAAEPLNGPDRDRLDQPLGEEDDDLEEDYVLDEGPPGAGMIDPTKDAENMPYREQDPFEFLGMHPKPDAAASPPDASGGGEASPAEPSDEPTKGE